MPEVFSLAFRKGLDRKGLQGSPLVFEDECPICVNRMTRILAGSKGVQQPERPSSDSATVSVPVSGEISVEAHLREISSRLATSARNTILRNMRSDPKALLPQRFVNLGHRI